MTDNKLTDEEIIEALDLCTQQNGSIPCYDCPCWNDDEQECEGICYTAIFDLIKRQKSEIERLQYLLDEEEKKYTICAKHFYKEAIKEFAERMKEKLGDCHIVSDGEYCGFDCGDIHECIDTLLKEMVGEEE